MQYVQNSRLQAGHNLHCLAGHDPNGFSVGWLEIFGKSANSISNNRSFRLKHPGVRDSSDGSGGTLYPLTENQTLHVAQATGCVAYLPCGGYYTMPLIGFLYFASVMW